MPWATSQVSATLIGQISSSGASIQSRISPNSERWPFSAASAGSAGAALIGARSGRNLLEAVAEAAHGGDADRALLDLLAQPVDVDLDRVVADLFAPLAQALDQLVLADQAAGALQQHLQQAQLARRQLDHLLVDVGDPASRVETHRPVLDEAGGRAEPAPRQRAHARPQLLQRERLGHVVVGPPGQAPHP